MKSQVRLLLFALACTLPLSAGATVLLQQNSNYLAFEAEQYTALTRETGSANWTVITTSSGTKTLPANTNAVGSAIYTDGGGENAFATYTLRFTSSGTYYLYSRYSFFEKTNVADYGNEDSILAPAALGQAAASTGTWHTQHLSFLTHNPTTNPNEGQKFYWDLANIVDTTTPISYVVTGASEATPVDLTFTIRSREHGVALDRFVFIKTTQTLTGADSAFLNSLVSVPEPSQALLFGLAVVGLMFRRRR